MKLLEEANRNKTKIEMQMSMEFSMNMHTYYVVIRSIYVRRDRT